VRYYDDNGVLLANMSGEGSDFAELCDRYFQAVQAAAQTLRTATGMLESAGGLQVSVTVRRVDDPPLKE
jgi:hypothetical protein